MKKIVVIGGGTGTFVVLDALKKYPVWLTAVVSMADEGGSTGILRDQYGVLPPGDVRRALIALSPETNILRKLFSYRFSGGDFGGHSFGNLFLSALEKIEGNITTAIREAGKILNIKGTVVPVTLDNVRLHARLTDGTVIQGENNIDIPKDLMRAAIKEVWLSPRGKANPEALVAIKEADIIIIGPGDLYSSLIPNLLVEGISQAICVSSAKKVYIGNLMTKFGETQGFRADDFVREIEKYLGKPCLDYAIFNNKKASARLLRKYKSHKSEFVYADVALPSKKPWYIVADLLDGGPFVRHDRKKLPQILFPLLNKEIPIVRPLSV